MRRRHSSESRTLALWRQTKAAVLAGAIVIASLAGAACGEPAIVRNGPPQQRVVSRVYPRGVAELRALILERYTSARAFSDAFRVLEISEQPPSGFAPDWLMGYVDPGGYLSPYRRLPASATTNDLVLREATGDKYWLSEYQRDNAPVLFHCGLIIHFVARSAMETELQIFEVVPTVLVGRRWGMAKEGVGFGRFADIRFVEPTMAERLAVLDFVSSILP